VNVAVISSSPVNLFAAALVARLAADDRPPVAIICTQRSRIAMARGYLRKHGIWKTLDRGLDAVQVRPSRTNSIRKILGEYAVQHGLTQWDVPLRTAADRFGVEFVETESLNAASAVGYVRTRGINVLLNAGSELFRRAIIEAPTHGILNAHMGYLPMYRGYNVLEWSLFRGDPIGVTLHFIDTGIDTGDIIRFQPIAVEPSDSLEDLRAKTFPVDIEQMVYAVRQLEGGVLSGTAQAEAEGRQYFSMHRRLIAITRKRLAARVSGRAVRT
jgi:folate-dependent phosphoribosylglycinamide formyltransferase PurN